MFSICSSIRKMCRVFFFRNSHLLCRLLWLVSIVQKAEGERESPGDVLGGRLRLLGPQSEDRAGGEGEPVVCCRPDTDRLATIEQTGEASKLRFWSAAPPQMGVPRITSSLRPVISSLGLVPPALYFRAPLCFCVFIRWLRGCYEGLDSWKTARF